MENKTNIAELLKDAPTGIKLYSKTFGYVTFLHVEEWSAYELYGITCKKANGYTHTFYKDGRLSSAYEDGECVLFPSKECQTWENFEASWSHKHFEPFSKILVYVACPTPRWKAEIYSHYDNNEEKHIGVSGFMYEDNEVISYEGNEDKLGKEVK